MNIINILLLVLLLVSWCYFLYFKKQKSLETGNFKQLSEENKILTQKVKESESQLSEIRKKGRQILARIKAIEESVPIFDDKLSIKENLTLLEDFWNGEYAGKKVFLRDRGADDFFSKLRDSIDASAIMIEMQDNVTTPFKIEMDTVSSQTSDSEICAKIIDMSMKLYDVVSSFNAVNLVNEQQLNVGLVKGMLTREKALQNAIPITELETNTPRWIRNIRRGVSCIDQHNKQIIYSGYKIV